MDAVAMLAFARGAEVKGLIVHAPDGETLNVRIVAVAMRMKMDGWELIGLLIPERRDDD